MDPSLSYSASRLELQMSRPEPAEMIAEKICIMSQSTKPDITLYFLHTEYCGSAEL